MGLLRHLRAIQVERSSQIVVKAVLPFAPLYLLQQNAIDGFTQGAVFGQDNAVIFTVESVRQNLKAPLELVMDQVTKNRGIEYQRLNIARLNSTQACQCIFI